MGKLPYIPNKKLYGAVMCACKYIRETGNFHKAVNNAAAWYDVEVEDVEKYVRIAQSNGQKKANANKAPRKYKWFIVGEYTGCPADGESHLSQLSLQIVRAIDKEHAGNRFAEADLRNTMADDYGGEYSLWHVHTVIGDGQGYATKAEAQDALIRIKSKLEEACAIKTRG